MKENIDSANLPAHIAIIMDGNRRWAKEKGLDAAAGHQKGVDSVRKVSDAANKLGVKYLTIYAFSTENWSRSRQEVDFLMELMVETIDQETPELNKNNIRILAIGNLNGLPQRSKDKFLNCMKVTEKNTGLKLVIALNYSSRWEIVNAVKMLAEEVKQGKRGIDEITEETIPDYLTTKNIPDPDLLIRTSGELRLSNFLLWQSAYTEFYFTNAYWPDFRENNFYEAIIEYQKRTRRFGK